MIATQVSFLYAPNFSDVFRPFPMTSDFPIIVPQRNQSEGSQTIQLICMTVGTILTPNAALLVNHLRWLLLMRQREMMLQMSMMPWHNTLH